MAPRTTSPICPFDEIPLLVLRLALDAVLV